MLLIPCPFCGARSESEFIYGGPVRAARPDPNVVSDADWVDYLTVVPNPLGPVQEHWWHARGCGEWLTIWRDTRTHDIVEAPDEIE
ncbi:sarcosine oxidase subunit delta [Ruegeria sp. 2205SS24-7]|uniref:sarcosine oxidase subunit delta n=1 Tax=Ruegeria discodermiae TaxID=3064389 RepID=UPI002740955E|nr:sarcosine oxidase subunit delta [Ruegeria sp. 2205SS24-7]MDP5218545.1 sarcosine oxidase subunit delta [Ruegeria sp. 2205SS24-7]